jgi:hypothetical protein
VWPPPTNARRPSLELGSSEVTSLFPTPWRIAEAFTMRLRVDAVEYTLAGLDDAEQRFWMMELQVRAKFAVHMWSGACDTSA